MGRTRRHAAAVAALALGALLIGCGSSSGSDEATTTTTEAEATTTAIEATTSEAPTTTAAETTTTVAEATTTTSMSAGLEPGDPCSLEEGVPDCIDPDGDGEGTYLIGGAACIADSPDPALCTDLDGDGNAGYPDAG